MARVTAATSAATVENLLKTLHGSASSIQALADDWYTVTEEYQEQVESLRNRVETYEKHRRMYGGLSCDVYMVTVLERATRRLKIEEERVKKLDDGIDGSTWTRALWLLYAKLNMIAFPERMERILKKVTTGLDRIPKTMQMELDFVALQDKHDLIQSISPLRREDGGFYVPIEAAESAVTTELENGTSAIVLLHGGFGKGKSVLASRVCELYEKRRDLFENVCILDCGNVCEITDPAAKLQKLLQNLAPSMVGGEGQLPDARIDSNLRGFLRDRKILIILDNLMDSRFFEKMYTTARGQKVKYLVTSQRSDLCDSYPRERRMIQMQDTTKDEARQILASLVGLEGIPNHLLDIANQLIEATGGNPLALACLSRYFARGDIIMTDRPTWQHAYADLRRVLDQEGLKCVYGGAPPSLWTSVQLSINSLLKREDAKKLLVVMYACEETSAAQEVLEVLFERVKSRNGDFRSEMVQLEMSELVKRYPERKSATRPRATRSEGEDQDQDLHESTVQWSLRSLVKLHIEHNWIGNDEMKPVVDLLAGRETLVNLINTIEPVQGKLMPYLAEKEKEENEKERVAAALCDLYFDRAHILNLLCMSSGSSKDASMITEKYLNATTAREKEKDTKNLRRDAVEPLVRLLVQPVFGKWTASHQRCVRKVFLEYICNSDRVEVEGITDLIRLIEYPRAPLETIRAIRGICRIESLVGENSFLKENAKCMFEAFADLLDLEKVQEGIQVGSQFQDDSKEMSYRLQEETCKALVVLSWKAVEEESSFLIWTPSLLQALQRLLHESNCRHSVRVDAAQILWTLVLEGEEGIQAGVETVIDDHEGAQFGSSQTSLSDDHDELLELAKLKIVYQKGLPLSPDLVKVLSEHDKPGDLCEPAVEALYSLACGLDPLIIRKIVAQKWAISSLVRALSTKAPPQLQTSATKLLGLLAAGPEDKIRDVLIHQDGLLDGLVRSLSNLEYLYMRERAASAIANLAMGVEADSRLIIVRHDAALKLLAESLCEHVHPGLQERAARAIANLALGSQQSTKVDRRIVKRILEEGGSVPGMLLKLSRLRPSSRLAEVAMEALKNLLFQVSSKMDLSSVNEMDVSKRLALWVLLEDHDTGRGPEVVNNWLGSQDTERNTVHSDPIDPPILSDPRMRKIMRIMNEKI